MNDIDYILTALNERTIAREVGTRHDETRLRRSLKRNTVDSFGEFETFIGDYYNYHHAECFAHGGQLSPAAARGRAKQIIEREYRRRNGDLVTCYNDAHDGTNGGLRAILDILADGLKEEAIAYYVQDVFDRVVTPNSWDDKVRIIQEFIARCGGQLAGAIEMDQPERYAHDYRDLIQAYVHGLRQTSSLFRSL